MQSVRLSLASLQVSQFQLQGLQAAGTQRAAQQLQEQRAGHHACQLVQQPLATCRRVEMDVQSHSWEADSDVSFCPGFITDSFPLKVDCMGKMWTASHHTMDISGFLSCKNIVKSDEGWWGQTSGGLEVRGKFYIQHFYTRFKLLQLKTHIGASYYLCCCCETIFNVFICTTKERSQVWWYSRKNGSEISGAVLEGCPLPAESRHTYTLFPHYSPTASSHLLFSDSAFFKQCRVSSEK